MSPRDARHRCPWQAPAPPARTQVNLYASSPWPHGNCLVNPGMNQGVSFLTSVGFTTTALLLQDRTGGLPHSQIYDNLWARTPSMPVLQLCRTWCFGGIWTAFLGMPVMGIAREGKGKGQGLARP